MQHQVTAKLGRATTVQLDQRAGVKRKPKVVAQRVAEQRQQRVNCGRPIAAWVGDSVILQVEVQATATALSQQR
jgi:hypothetical protein